MKQVVTKFRCTIFEKKLIRIKAKNASLSVSEYCRRSAMDKKVVQRLTEEEIEIYQNLVTFHNNFKWIGNMFRKKDPGLTKAVYDLADEIKEQLKKLRK
ncbi:hypothetical protein JM79_2933 [Gramella sp. Hel_I_59]|uniref:mobilization protein MbpA n=1 Tax=Gramella sp. Hel_I_59 TaxID=1249978 RepID=UPI001152165E|nr:mobilization protein MbpA [Gramella sp. Hel_I_59]TQI71982.1 hypothetical protein JM79_2933 [Gramella sp. Hel_I_59]